jgi:hypothetical protein
MELVAAVDAMLLTADSTGTHFCCLGLRKMCGAILGPVNENTLLHGMYNEVR